MTEKQQPSQPWFMTTVTGLPVKLPPPFAPQVTAPHPVAHCLCTWVWAPAIGGKENPFALKYWNRVCHIKHF